jgi:hypothetical protein
LSTKINEEISLKEKVDPTKDMVYDIFFSNVDLGKFSKTLTESAANQILNVIKLWESNRHKYVVD